MIKIHVGAPLPVEWYLTLPPPTDIYGWSQHPNEISFIEVDGLEVYIVYSIFNRDWLHDRGIVEHFHKPEFIPYGKSFSLYGDIARTAVANLPNVLGWWMEHQDYKSPY